MAMAQEEDWQAAAPAAEWEYELPLSAMAMTQVEDWLALLVAWEYEAPPVASVFAPGFHRRLRCAKRAGREAKKLPLAGSPRLHQGSRPRSAGTSG